jgi:hypothetical protein
MADKEPTRAELLALLEASEAQRRAVESERDQLKADQTAELAQAQAELARLRPNAAQAVPPAQGSRPRLIPYKGMVQAKEPCVYDHKYETGQVFEVDVPALFTDDPYVPVVVQGHSESGTPLTEVNPLAPPPVDFRFRPRSHDVLNDPTPRRANEF